MDTSKNESYQDFLRGIAIQVNDLLLNYDSAIDRIEAMKTKKAAGLTAAQQHEHGNEAIMIPNEGVAQALQLLLSLAAAQ